MNDETLEHLRRDGVARLSHYLHDAAVAKLLDASSDGAAGHDEVESLRIKRGVPFARRNLLSNERVREFAHDGPVRGLVEAAAPGAMPVRAILFDKTGDANWTVPWHQDRSIAVLERREAPGFGPWSVKAGVVHVQPPVEVLRQMVTLRFSLDACDLDNGPLRTIAETHHEILSAPAVEAAVARGPEQVQVTAAGGVVVMRPLVLHASSPARRPGHRRVLHIEFGPPTLPGGLAWAIA